MFIKTIEQRINNQIIIDTLYDDRDKSGNDGQIRRILNPSFDCLDTFILVNGDVMRRGKNISHKKAHNTIMRLLKQAK